jgi:3-polyprenyl-4-hydroxybenzoate decarboxylase
LLSGGRYSDNEELPLRILDRSNGFAEELQKWPLVIIVDDVKTVRDQTAFLWEVFTRFAPGSDIYAQNEMKDNRVVFHGPIIIDARMKPFYPDVVTADEKTVKLVDQRWSEYGIKL